MKHGRDGCCIGGTSRYLKMSPTEIDVSPDFPRSETKVGQLKGVFRCTRSGSV